MKWQPTEIAPKDGTRFHTYHKPTGQRTYTMHWDGEEFLTEYEPWCGAFTHWMLPPASPTEDT